MNSFTRLACATQRRVVLSCAAALEGRWHVFLQNVLSPGVEERPLTVVSRACRAESAVVCLPMDRARGYRSYCEVSVASGAVPAVRTCLHEGRYVPPARSLQGPPRWGVLAVARRRRQCRSTLPSRGHAFCRRGGGRPAGVSYAAGRKWIARCMALCHNESRRSIGRRGWIIQSWRLGFSAR